MLRVRAFSAFVRSILHSSTPQFYQQNKIRTEVSLEKIMEESTSIVWMDLEMTGLDVDKDTILEISCIVSDKDLNVIDDAYCISIHQPKEVLDNMIPWSTKQHMQSGLVEKCKNSSISTKSAEIMAIDYLKKHVPKGKCPLAGNSVYMDRLFLRKEMPILEEYMHYRNIDVSTVKELCRRWNPSVFMNAPKKKFAHRSLEDILESIEELKYYRDNFFRKI